MPRLDRTGPLGEGAMMGGGRGRCSGLRKSGMGLGRGKCYRASGSAGQGAGLQFSDLQEKFDQLKAELEAFKAKSQ